jgi:hypothetical protein
MGSRAARICTALHAVCTLTPDWWKGSGGTDDELLSDCWIPFAGRDSDSLAIHGVSGRVFLFEHDDAPQLLASSLIEWLQRFVDRIAAGDYKVEKGFGDYFLTLRDREAEQQSLEHAERRSAHNKMRNEIPLQEQFVSAVSAKDAHRCIEVLQDALKRDDKPSFNSFVASLFTDNLTPKFVASALRPVLSSVTLNPDQWLDIAVGGALLENNAIRGFAATRAIGYSPKRLRQLQKSHFKSVVAGERKALGVLLQQLKAKEEPRAQAEKTGSWFSRLWGNKKPPRT